MFKYCHLHVFFYSLLFTHYIVLWEFIHIYVAQIHSFILTLSTPLNKYITIYLFNYWYPFGLFPIVALWDNATITTLVNVSSSTHEQRVDLPDLGTFNFTKYCQFAFESDCPNLYAHHQSRRVAVVSYPCQNLAFR